MSYILRLEDDPIHRKGCRVISAFLFLAEEYSRESGWWSEKLEDGIKFRSIKKALEAARNQHICMAFRANDRLGIITPSGRKVRRILRRELNGGIRPTVPAETEKSRTKNNKNKLSLDGLLDSNRQS